MTVHALEVASPLGILQLISEADYLVELNWEGTHKALSNTTGSQPAILATAADELSQFFSGHRHDFSVPVKPMGTAFQLSVWRELQTIKWGVTYSYLDIAKRLGKPRGSRAVGGAVGRNPIPIFIPCHRIVGASGSLTGFSGGLQNKKKLLECEGRPL
jgi:methylated-DNA-[protein]-cysteine S-methyltransferase